MSATADASSARQTLRRIAEQLAKRVESARSVRGEVMAASLSRTYKICGQPNCKCARGEKHEVYQLSWVEDGRRRSTHIRQDELPRVRAAVERYKHLRHDRAEMVKLAAEAASSLEAASGRLLEPPDLHVGCLGNGPDLLVCEQEFRIEE